MNSNAINGIKGFTKDTKKAAKNFQHTLISRAELMSYSTMNKPTDSIKKDSISSVDSFQLEFINNKKPEGKKSKFASNTFLFSEDEKKSYFSSSNSISNKSDIEEREEREENEENEIKYVNFDCKIKDKIKIQEKIIEKMEIEEKFEKKFEKKIEEKKIEDKIEEKLKEERLKEKLKDKMIVEKKIEEKIEKEQIFFQKNEIKNLDKNIEGKRILLKNLSEGNVENTNKNFFFGFKENKDIENEKNLNLKKNMINEIIESENSYNKNGEKSDSENIKQKENDNLKNENLFREKLIKRKLEDNFLKKEEFKNDKMIEFKNKNQKILKINPLKFIEEDDFYSPMSPRIIPELSSPINNFKDRAVSSKFSGRKLDFFTTSRKNLTISTNSPFSLRIKKVEITNEKRSSNNSENPIQQEKQQIVDYLTFLAFRPVFWEHNAIHHIIKVSPDNLRKNENLTLIWSTISSAATIPKIHLMKKKFKCTIFTDTGLPYLYYYSEKIKNGDTKFKADPPIRNKENRNLLQRALDLNLIQIVSSCNSYSKEKYKIVKNNDFNRAWNGLCDAGMNLVGLWTILYQTEKSKNLNKFREEIFNQGSFSLNNIFCKMKLILCENPAKSIGIFHKKGSISIGKDADFVIWDPFDKFKFCFSQFSKFQSKNIHIFNDKFFNGLVIRTYLRGNIIFDEENSSIIEDSLRGKKI